MKVKIKIKSEKFISVEFFFLEGKRKENFFL